jgi:vacuolar-type H+-ATPase subunit I/STV1
MIKSRSTAALLAGLGIGLAGAPQVGLEFGLAAGLIFGLLAWLVAGLTESAGRSPARTTLLRLRQMFNPSSLMTGLAAGLVLGFAALAVGLQFGFKNVLAYGAIAGLGTGILIWLVFGLATVLSTGLTQPEAPDTSPLTPTRLLAT